MECTNNALAFFVVVVAISAKKKKKWFCSECWCCGGQGSIFFARERKWTMHLLFFCISAGTKNVFVGGGVGGRSSG